MGRIGAEMSRNNLDLNINSLELEGQTVVCLAIDQVPRLVFSLEEEYPTRKEAMQVVKYLKQHMGIRVAMLTGDNMSSAQKVATFLDIPHDLVFFKASPG